VVQCHGAVPEATIVAHIPWLPLATTGAVFTQYMWAGHMFIVALAARNPAAKELTYLHLAHWHPETD